MSTLAYAEITNKRDEAASGTSTTTSSPGIKSYLDVFAALVPAEILTLHALIISATTQTTAAGASLGTVTTIPPDSVGTLSLAFWGLVALCIGFYAFPRLTGGSWDKFDWIRALIAPLAFVGWTMLQRATAFDAVFPGVGQTQRTVVALFLGTVLAGVTATLASKADAKPSP